MGETIPSSKSKTDSTRIKLRLHLMVRKEPFGFKHRRVGIGTRITKHKPICRVCGEVGQVAAFKLRY